MGGIIFGSKSDDKEQLSTTTPTKEQLDKTENTNPQTGSQSQTDTDGNKVSTLSTAAKYTISGICLLIGGGLIYGSYTGILPWGDWWTQVSNWWSGKTADQLEDVVQGGDKVEINEDS